MNNLEQIALFVIVLIFVCLIIDYIQEKASLKIRVAYVERIKKLNKELQELSSKERSSEYGRALRNELIKIMFEYTGKYEE